MGLGNTFKLPGMVAYQAPNDKQQKQLSQPSFDTTLDPAQEKQFAIWKAANAANDSGQDYDLRGAFLAAQGKEAKDARGHMTDQFKKPNHYTFSVESKYNGVNGEVGGRWEEKNGKTYFYASPTNLKYHSAKELKEYFKKTEPDVVLVLPHGSK